MEAIFWKMILLAECHFIIVSIIIFLLGDVEDYSSYFVGSAMSCFFEGFFAVYAGFAFAAVFGVFTITGPC